MQGHRNLVTIDYGEVNLKSLVLTNDVEHYKKMKAQGNIGVLFEPSVLNDKESQGVTDFYLVGIMKDK